MTRAETSYQTLALKAAAILVAAIISVFCCACSSGSTSDSSGGNETARDTTESDGVTDTKAWELATSRDEFGDVTEDSVNYIRSFFSGTFSNTATTSSNFNGIVTISWNYDAQYEENGVYLVQFTMLEYSDTPFTYTSSDIELDNQLKTKSSSGDKQSYAVVGSAPDGAIGFIDGGLGGGGFIKSLLGESGDMRCILNFGSTTFDFTLNGNGFAEVFSDYNQTISDSVAEPRPKALWNILPMKDDKHNGSAMDYFEETFSEYRQLTNDEIERLFPGTYCFIDFRNVARSSMGYVYSFTADSQSMIAKLGWFGYEQQDGRESEYQIEDNKLNHPYPNCWVYEVSEGYYLLWRNGEAGQTRPDTDIPDLLLMYACDETGNPTSIPS